MNKLYIIGNGFDLYHGLPSRYADFHRFVADNDPDLLERMDTYFDFQVDQNYLWGNFEQDLCKFDHEGLMDTYDHIDVLSESFKPSEFFGLEDEVSQEAENLVEQIRGCFTNWVETFDFSEIPENYTSLKLDTEAFYINFNYTDTLEELYHIPKDRILYIHHNANAYDGELIFGHAQVSDQAEVPTFDEDGEPTRTMRTDAQNASRGPFYAFIKDTKAVLKEHRLRFADLKNLNEVIVLGHSLGKVDWPYFRAIAKNNWQAEWRISYYSDWELSYLQKHIKAISRKIRYRMITFNQLS